MGAGSLFDGVLSESDGRADRRERSADYTPDGVIRQILGLVRVSEWSRGHWRVSVHAHPTARSDHHHLPDVQARPLRVLDFCAGAGSWSQHFRQMFGAIVPLHITGVEVCEEDRPFLELNCDEPVIGNWRSLMGLDSSRWDLVVGNPAFPEVFEALPWLLSVSPGVLFLWTSDALQRTKAGRQLALEYIPVFEACVAGGVEFRGPGTSSDRISYSAFFWQRGHFSGRDGWRRFNLPDLPASARGWNHRPGTLPLPQP